MNPFLTRPGNARMRPALVALSGVALLTTLSACASQGASSDASETTLTVQFLQGTEVAYQAYADGFEAANPGVTVELQAVSSDAKNGSNLSVITSDSAPDVALVPGNSPAYNSLVAAGGLADLAPVWEEADLDARYPETTNALTEYDGKHYSIADTASYYSIVYYNADLFAEAGLTPPLDHRIESEAQLVEYAEGLKAVGAQPLAISGKSGFEVSWMVDALLPTAVDDETLENYLTSWTASVPVSASYTDDGFAEALSTLQDYEKQGVYADGFLGTDYVGAQSLFAQQSAGMLLDGSWYAGQLREAEPGFEFDWALLPPVDPAKPTQLTGSSTPQYAVPAKAKHKDLAMDYLAYMMSDEGQEEAGVKAAGYLPTVNTLSAESLEALDPLVQEMIADANANGVQNGWTSTVPSTIGQALIDPLMQAMYSGGETPEDIAAAVDAALPDAREQSE